jgi:hypothetical protein
MLHKNLLRLLLISLVLTATVALEPAPVSAGGGFCADIDGKYCFNQGQTLSCTWLGCCGYVSSEFCQCVNGHWDCPDSPECPPDYCH